MVIWDWIQQFFLGVIQTILYWIPLLKPLVLPLLPPDFYLPCDNFYSMWTDLLDGDQRPTQGWIEGFWSCIWTILFGRVDDRILELIDFLMHYVVFAVGMLPLPFVTIPEWLLAIRGWIGEILPDWASDIAAGLWRLWNLIPEPIRDGLLTWSEFVSGAPEAIQEWLEEFLAQTLQRVVELWAWFTGLGQDVTDWWIETYERLTDLLDDAYGWIVGVLGEAWSFLIWFWNDPAGAVAGWVSPLSDALHIFARDCLDFWYNIWGSYAEDLAEFLADPLDFLWTRGELWLNRRLEQP